MIKFEVGKRYFEKASYPTTKTYLITRRTEKSVWDHYGQRHVIKVSNDGVEYFNIGSYAWHPICTADYEWSAEEEQRIERREGEYFRMA